MSRRREPRKAAAAADTETHGTVGDIPPRATVALVGRPNVGKSSLFNRLVGGRPALVEDRPGVTRDRRYGICAWDGDALRMVDTGGLNPSADGILGAMRGQTLRAVAEADILVLVIDSKEGVTGLDRAVAEALRKSGKPVVLAANKVDSNKREESGGDAYTLGFPDVFLVSAGHGRGIGDLLDRLVAMARERNPIAEAGTATPGSAPTIRVAFAGKPNAGKSSLVNRLLGEERVLVHHEAGTTRDPIDTPLSFDGRPFVLVDTAGLRRRAVVADLTEAVAAKMARDQIARADVVVLVVDLAAGASDDDARLASLVEESGRALVVALNKSDRVPRAGLDAAVEKARERLHFASWAPIVTVSALTGRNVTDLLTRAVEAFGEWTRRVPTPELNRHLDAIVRSRPPPAGPAGRHIRLYYMTQAQVRPPTFFVSTNLPSGVPHPYRRYLANQIRTVYGFAGTPVRMVMRAKSREPRNPQNRR